MGIEQIRMNQTKALPPAFQSNWSQMESNHLSVSVNHVDYFWRVARHSGGFWPEGQ